MVIGGEKLFACLSLFILLFGFAISGCAAPVVIPSPEPTQPLDTPALTPLAQPDLSPTSTRAALPTAAVQTETQAAVVEQPVSSLDPTPLETASLELPGNCKISNTIGFLSCIDDTRSLTIDIPDRWLEVHSAAWVYQGEAIGATFSAAPNLASFSADKNAPGLLFASAQDYTQWGGYLQFMDAYTSLYSQACKFESRVDYNDSVFRGKLDRYTNCDDRPGGEVYVLAAVPLDEAIAALVVIVVQWPNGEEAPLDHLWNSFYIGDF
jgi:hypothetical protein